MKLTPNDHSTRTDAKVTNLTFAEKLVTSRDQQINAFGVRCAKGQPLFPPRLSTPLFYDSDGDLVRVFFQLRSLNSVNSVDLFFGTLFSTLHLHYFPHFRLHKRSVTSRKKKRIKNRIEQYSFIASLFRINRIRRCIVLSVMLNPH